MGLSGSKNKISDEELLAQTSVPGKYGQLLVDERTKVTLDALMKLVRHNHMNDMNYLAMRVAKVADKKLPILLRLSSMYSNMLLQVHVMRPDLATDVQAFHFLANDTNLLSYFVHEVTKDGKTAQEYLTGKESPETAQHLAEMTSSVKQREARLRFFQFKYAQSTLFHVAFSANVWEVSQLFIKTTEAFHKTRENAFNQVYQKLTTIINDYVGRDQLKPMDIQNMEGVKELMDDTQHLMQMRKSMETHKIQNLDVLMAELAKLESSVVSDYPNKTATSVHRPTVAALTIQQRNIGGARGKDEAVKKIISLLKPESLPARDNKDEQEAFEAIINGLFGKVYKDTFTPAELLGLSIDVDKQFYAHKKVSSARRKSQNQNQNQQQNQQQNQRQTNNQQSNYQSSYQPQYTSSYQPQYTS